MARLPIYTTFASGELERQLTALAQRAGVVSDAPDGWRARRTHRFHLKHHECAVIYPDGTDGVCYYTRHGPKVHAFSYAWGEPKPRTGYRERLPLVTILEELGKDAASIEAVAREKASVAFGYAIEQERKDARRAQPPWTGHGSRNADQKLATLSRERAMALAGKYALCIHLQPSGKLLATPGTFESLDEANAAWRESGDDSLVVAIASRWARRWMPLRLNPLYVNHPQPG